MISTETPPEDAQHKPGAIRDGLQSLGRHAKHSTFDQARTGAIMPAAGVPALTKAELSQALVEQLGLNKREAKEFVEAFFALLLDALVRTREIKLGGFGNFIVHHKPPRPGRNPRTGENVPIEARHVVRFRASPALKSAVQSRSAPLDADD